MALAVPLRPPTVRALATRAAPKPAREMAGSMNSRVTADRSSVGPLPDGLASDGVQPAQLGLRQC